MSLGLLLVPIAVALAAPASPVPQAAPVPAQATRSTADGSVASPAAAPHRPVRHAKGDPLERFNRRMFRLYLGLDRAAIRPAALGYKHVVPKPVRSGLRNFFRNLSEPVVFVNYLLQLKPGKAAETAARFVVNATVGVGGLIDVAKQPPINLPHRPNGLGDTLGFYGVKPGPYLFLPLIGPTSLRDLIGVQADGALLPLAVGKPFDRAAYLIPQAIITGLDTRAESDDDLRALTGQSVDPYATLRSSYQQDRQGEIDALKAHGRRRDDASAGELAQPLADPAPPPASPSAPPTRAPELQDPLADPATPPITRPAAPSPAPELRDPLADSAAPPR